MNVHVRATCDGCGETEITEPAIVWIDRSTMRYGWVCPFCGRTNDKPMTWDCMALLLSAGVRDLTPCEEAAEIHRLSGGDDIPPRITSDDVINFHSDLQLLELEADWLTWARSTDESGVRGPEQTLVLYCGNCCDYVCVPATRLSYDTRARTRRFLCNCGDWMSGELSALNLINFRAAGCYDATPPGEWLEIKECSGANLTVDDVLDALNELFSAGDELVAELEASA